MFANKDITMITFNIEKNERSRDWIPKTRLHGRVR